MAKKKLVLCINIRISPELDKAIKEGVSKTYLNRSDFIRTAVIEKIQRLDDKKN